MQKSRESKRSLFAKEGGRLMMVEYGDGLCYPLFMFNDLKFKIFDDFILWAHNVGDERFFDFCFVSSGFPFPDSLIVMYRFVLPLSAGNRRAVS